MNAADCEQMVAVADRLFDKHSVSIRGFQGRGLDVESQSECASAQHPYGEHVCLAALGLRVLRLIVALSLTLPPACSHASDRLRI